MNNTAVLAALDNNAAAFALAQRFEAEIAPAERIKALAVLEAAEAMVARKKTASNEELTECARTCSLSSAGYNFVKANAETLPQRSYFIPNPGARSTFVHNPEADQLETTLVNVCQHMVITDDEMHRLNVARVAMYNCVQGRHAKTTRDANAAKRAADADAAKAFAVGETVQVHAFGHWYKGTVKSINKNGRIVAEYTSGTGVTREKTCSSDLVKKA